MKYAVLDVLRKKALKRLNYSKEFYELKKNFEDLKNSYNKEFSQKIKN